MDEEAKKLVLQNGNVFYLGAVYRGFRQMTSLRPIKKPEDLIGLRLRLPVVKAWIAVWESLGDGANTGSSTETVPSAQKGKSRGF